MHDHLNVSYITLDGYVEVKKFGSLYFFVMFIVYVFIICSNSTIVFLICIQPSLHEPMYIFIAALSLNAVLFTTVIYPKFFVDVLSERQIISYPACLFQFFSYYFLGLSDFSLLAAMAFDRYVCICKPLRHSIIMRKTNIIALLLLAWFLPACHTLTVVVLSASERLCTFTLKGFSCNNLIYKLHCVRSRVLFVFGMISFLDTVISPMLFIILTYTKILFISFRSSGDVRKKAAETCLPHLLVLISVTCLGVYDLTMPRLESYFSKTASLIMGLQLVLYHPIVNPIIYGLKMKEINKHIKKLLCQVKVK